MAFHFINPNPNNNNTGDCAVRAISMAMDQDWNKTYLDLCFKGFEFKVMPSNKRVLTEYLKENGWHRYIIPDTCPSCYTVKDFCGEYFRGTYILCSESHAVAVIDGDYWDTWNSGDEFPIYYWTKGEAE